MPIHLGDDFVVLVASCQSVTHLQTHQAAYVGELELKQ